MFYSSDSEREALMSGSALPLRTTPSVAEQEGQLIETEIHWSTSKTPSYTKSE
jgi:hypothetical protein